MEYNNKNDRRIKRAADSAKRRPKRTQEQKARANLKKIGKGRNVSVNDFTHYAAQTKKLKNSYVKNTALVWPTPMSQAWSHVLKAKYTLETKGKGSRLVELGRKYVGRIAQTHFHRLLEDPVAPDVTALFSELSSILQQLKSPTMKPVRFAYQAAKKLYNENLWELRIIAPTPSKVVVPNIDRKELMRMKPSAQRETVATFGKPQPAPQSPSKKNPFANKPVKKDEYDFDDVFGDDADGIDMVYTNINKVPKIVNMDSKLEILKSNTEKKNPGPVLHVHATGLQAIIMIENYLDEYFPAFQVTQAQLRVIVTQFYSDCVRNGISRIFLECAGRLEELILVAECPASGVVFGQGVISLTPHPGCNDCGQCPCICPVCWECGNWPCVCEVCEVCGRAPCICLDNLPATEQDPNADRHNREMHSLNGNIHIFKNVAPEERRLVKEFKGDDVTAAMQLVVEMRNHKTPEWSLKNFAISFSHKARKPLLKLLNMWPHVPSGQQPAQALWNDCLVVSYGSDDDDIVVLRNGKDTFKPLDVVSAKSRLVPSPPTRSTTPPPPSDRSSSTDSTTSIATGPVSPAPPSEKLPKAVVKIARRLAHAANTRRLMQKRGYEVINLEEHLRRAENNIPDPDYVGVEQLFDFPEAPPVPKDKTVAARASLARHAKIIERKPAPTYNWEHTSDNPNPLGSGWKTVTDATYVRTFNFHNYHVAPSISFRFTRFAMVLLATSAALLLFSLARSIQFDRVVATLFTVIKTEYRTTASFQIFGHTFSLLLREQGSSVFWHLVHPVATVLQAFRAGTSVFSTWIGPPFLFLLKTINTAGHILSPFHTADHGFTFTFFDHPVVVEGYNRLLMVLGWLAIASHVVLVIKNSIHTTASWWVFQTDTRLDGRPLLDNTAASELDPNLRVYLVTKFVCFSCRYFEIRKSVQSYRMVDVSLVASCLEKTSPSLEEGERVTAIRNYVAYSSGKLKLTDHIALRSVFVAGDRCNLSGTLRENTVDLINSAMQKEQSLRSIEQDFLSILSL